MLKSNANGVINVGSGKGNSVKSILEFLKVKGINAKAEIIILIEPSSIAVKPTNPFFIRMKELPQMNESAAR